MTISDSEQEIFGQTALGMEHTDYVMMRAPSPVLLLAATQDFFPVAQHVGLFSLCQAALHTNGICRARRYSGKRRLAQLRQGSARRGGTLDVAVAVGQRSGHHRTEAQVLFTRRSSSVPRRSVQSLPRDRSVYELIEDYENELAKHRAASWATGDRPALLEQVRQTAGVRHLAELPNPALCRSARWLEGYRIEKLLIKPEEGIWLPAVWFVPEKPKADGVVLYLHDKGKAADAAGGPIEQRVLAGDSVLAVDLRGTGQTQQLQGGHYSPEFKDMYIAYMLGRSYVGMRAEDVLVCACFVAQRAAAGRAVRCSSLRSAMWAFPFCTRRPWKPPFSRRCALADAEILVNCHS